MKSISRRKMLSEAAWLGTGLAFGLPLVTGTAEKAPGDNSKADSKLKVVVTGGHPGDPEYGCGGTIARFTDLGHEVVLLYLNRGDPEEKANGEGRVVRVAEARKPCENV